MCGIFAFISRLEISEELKVKLTKAAMTIKERGPDNTVTRMVDNTKYAVFHRLCINDLSELGNQPINHPDDMNITILCNGEIYNWKQLANNYQFNIKSSSDCEVIVHLYKRFGIERTVKELDGVFAFILIDNNTQKVWMARDPIGVRPLFFGKTADNNSVAICSELKGIKDIVSKDIQQLPAGTYSEVYEINPVKYYSHHYQTRKEKMEAILCKKIKQNLENAVEKRLLSDRPIGCLLSGGLDSSLITALVAQHYPRGKLKTFSVGLEGSVDLAYAKKVAEHLGTDHHEVILTEEQMLNGIEDTVYQIESWDTTTVRASTPIFLLSKYIKENTDVTVVFSGEGSDEASGSYMYFHNAPGPNEFKEETERLITDLRFFDVLRCDRSTAGAGLEVRVPFLDKQFLDYYMSIDPKFKHPNYSDSKIEKYLLRKSFDGTGLLPSDVLWRVKEGMSDGVSSQTRGWFEIIQEHAGKLVSDEEFETRAEKYSVNTPESKESLWFRNLFNKHYPGNDSMIPYYWLPKWCGNVKEASARVLNCYSHSGEPDEIDVTVTTDEQMEEEPVEQMNDSLANVILNAQVNVGGDLLDDDSEDNMVNQETPLVEESIAEPIELLVEDTQIESQPMETVVESSAQPEESTQADEVESQPMQTETVDEAPDDEATSANLNNEDVDGESADNLLESQDTGVEEDSNQAENHNRAVEEGSIAPEP